MKKQCVLRNLRSEEGYRLSIDINQNLLNNIRIWCMNSTDKMSYYLAPEFIDSINRDVWPEDLSIHAVYYYQGIKHDISEKTVLCTVLPDLNDIILGIECNGYIPNDVSNNSKTETPLLLSDGTKRDADVDAADVFEESSGYFFYDEDPDFFDATEQHHTIESDDNQYISKPNGHTNSNRNRKKSNANQSVEKKVSANSKTTQKKKYDEDSTDGMIQGTSSEERSKTNKSTNNIKKRNKNFAIVGIIIGIAIIFGVLMSTGHKPDNIVKEKKQSKDSQEDDIDFKNLLSQETKEDIHNIYSYDFDGNGKKEAFVTTIDSDDSEYDNLWYVSEQGATLVDEVGIVPQLLVTESEEILVPWRAGYGATLCYGIYHGQVKQLDFYKANIFQKEEKGTIYAVEEYFTDEGEYHKNIACEFDVDTYELVLTDDFYESNPAEDTDFCWNREEPEISDYQEPDDAASQDEINHTGDESFKESDLYQTAISSVSEPIQEWCYEDFDGDGKKEAFISTGDDDTYFTEDGEKSLWYLSDTGDVECIFDNEAYWYFSDEPFSFSDCKLFYIDARHGYYAVLGVQNDTPVEVSVPDDADYYWISQDPESGVVTAAGKREERAHVLEYDSANMSFVDTGKTLLND